jgi:outer membrane protein OmpA-like peptidoglycan-associated protein
MASLLKKHLNSYKLLSNYAVMLLSLCLNFALTAQNPKNDKEKEVKLLAFNPLDSARVIEQPEINFGQINAEGIYQNKSLLADIMKYRSNKQWLRMQNALYSYVSSFTVQNFLSVSDMDLLWQLARLAEHNNNLPLTKQLYRLLLKHYRGDIAAALLHYDTLTNLEKNLWVDVNEYYRLAERRKAIDTLTPPKDVLLNMGFEVNSPHEDYAPALWGEDDDKLLFTSRRYEKPTVPGILLSNNRGNEDIYLIEKDSFGYWGQPQSLEWVNSSFNEGSSAMNKAGTELIFVRCDAPDGYGDCDLYETNLQSDSTWTEPTNMGFGINSSSWDSHPAYSPSEDTLYFASDKRGGFGGSDIYMVTRGKKQQWMQPINLGPIINTRFNEVSPHVHPINYTLYFSSDGQLVNFGSFDIYKAFNTSKGYAEPKNIGPLVNGPGFEFYFTIDKAAKTLYYAKSEDKTDTNLDLYSFPLPMEGKPDNLVRFSGRVVEPTTGEVFQGVVSVIDMTEGVEVAPKLLKKDGSFSFELQPHKRYLVLVEGDNFFNIKEVIDLEEDTELAIPAIKTITFKSIDFEAGSAQLKPGMENNLHLIIDFLNNHPTYSIEVVGHTDSDGDPDFNLKLSTERAKAIKHYITSAGQIAENRITATGKGNSEPLIINPINASEKRLNRRVEFNVKAPTSKL